MNEVLRIALNEYGNKGIPGTENNNEVLKYYKEIGCEWVDDDDIAWCAAFLNWCLFKAEKQFLGSLRARDFLNYGIETKNPSMGDIVVLWRVSHESPYGHCGIFIKKTENTVYILGGNQQNSVNISPYHITQVLAYKKFI